MRHKLSVYKKQVHAVKSKHDLCLPPVQFHVSPPSAIPCFSEWAREILIRIYRGTDCRTTGCLLCGCDRGETVWANAKSSKGLSKFKEWLLVNKFVHFLLCAKFRPQCVLLRWRLLFRWHKVLKSGNVCRCVQISTKQEIATNRRAIF